MMEIYNPIKENGFRPRFCGVCHKLFEQNDYIDMEYIQATKSGAIAVLFGHTRCLCDLRSMLEKANKVRGEDGRCTFDE